MDAVVEWTNAQDRVITLVSETPPARLDERVPACPAWTVRQLLSHMIGLDADVLDGDEPDDHNSDWTQAQVTARGGCDVAALVAEWRSLTAPMTAWMRANGSRPLGDVIIHEQDLRGALAVPGARDTPALHGIRDQLAEGFADRARQAGAPVITLTGSDWMYSTADRTSWSGQIVVSASGYDLTRSLMSRRSAAQISGWVTAGDSEVLLPLFAGLGPLPEVDLVE